MFWQTVVCLLIGLLVLIVSRIPGVATPAMKLVRSALTTDFDFAGPILLLSDRLAFLSGDGVDRLVDVVPVLAGVEPAGAGSGSGVAREAAPTDSLAGGLPLEEATGVTSPPPDFVKPVSGRVVSWFGWRIGGGGEPEYHPGLDVGVESGTMVRAAAAGVVAAVGDGADGSGRYVILDHGGGWTTLYARNSRVLVTAGQSVARGEVIAMVGRGDGDTDPRVHLEVRANGHEKDPAVHFGLVNAD